MCNLQFGFKPHSYVKVDKENLIKFSLKDSVKNYLNDNTLDIFEKLTVLVVKKSTKNIQFEQNLTRYGQNRKKYAFKKFSFFCV